MQEHFPLLVRFAPTDLILFPNHKSALKGNHFDDTQDITKFNDIPSKKKKSLKRHSGLVTVNAELWSMEITSKDSKKDFFSLACHMLVNQSVLFFFFFHFVC